MKQIAFAVFLFAGAASAQISNFQTTDLNTPTSSQQAVDAFGTVWIVDPGANSLGTVDLATGAYTAVPVPSDENALLYNLATTPDGSVWYADYGHAVVGRRSAKGAFFRYSVPSPPYFIAGGADSGVFFNFLQKPTILGHLSADGGSYQQFNLPTGAVVENLTVGPDGAAYFTDLGANRRIVRVGPDGVVRTFSAPAANPPASFFWVPGITAGPDGNIWFTHATMIGRLRLTDGAVTEYPIPYASADASGITAGGDGNVWFADSFAGAGVVSQLVVSTATDDGHATINASPGISEPIGILAVAAEPSPPLSASAVRRASDAASPCPNPNFVVEQNRSSGWNLQRMSISAPDPKCAELELDVLEMRRAVDNPNEVLLAVSVANFGPDPAEDVAMGLQTFGTLGNVGIRAPGWNCDFGGAATDVCSRTDPLPAGRADLLEFDLTIDTEHFDEVVAYGNAHSSTPDPTPENRISAASALGPRVGKVLPPAAPVTPPVSRKPQSEEKR